MTTAPRILVTNDDGISAPGLKVLETIARALSDDVWIVAPETEQSGVSHSLTMHSPLRMRRINSRKYAVSGTPTDCVLMATRVVLGKRKKPFDLVLSGVNRGSNLGEDVTYSGTVAAAIEATLLGIPAIALSQCFTDGQLIHWSSAEHHAPGIIRQVLKAGWPKENLINLNFPDLPAAEVRGVQVVEQGLRHLGERITERHDPRGRPYYWIGSTHREDGDNPKADIAAARAGYITVTPLKIDLTDHHTLENLRKQVKNL